MSDPAFVASFLVGAVCGVLAVPLLAGCWLWWCEVRSAVREGTPLVGDGLERRKRRES